MRLFMAAFVHREKWVQLWLTGNTKKANCPGPRLQMFNCFVPHCLYHWSHYLLMWKTKCVLVKVALIGMLDLENTSSSTCFALKGWMHLAFCFISYCYEIFRNLVCACEKATMVNQIQGMQVVFGSLFLFTIFHWSVLRIKFLLH